MLKIKPLLFVLTSFSLANNALANNALLAQQCDINLNYGVVINNDHIRILDNGKTYLQINGSQQLFVNGKEIPLSNEQASLISDFSSGLRTDVPKIVSIAIKGIDISLKAGNQIIAGLQSLDLATLANRKQADELLSHYVDNIGIRQFLLRNIHKVNEKLAFKCNVDFIAQSYSQIVKGYSGSNTFNKPTLFIKGGDSDYITIEHREIISKLFPQSKAKIIQGAGHWLHAEKTTVFNKVVSDFIKN